MSDLPINVTSEVPISHNRGINIETSSGRCHVELGPWENIGIGGEIPRNPHVVQLEQLGIHDNKGNLITNVDNVSVMYCHGYRPDQGLLKTLEGHLVYEIVNKLRGQGVKIDAIGICDQSQDGQSIKFQDIKSLNPPVVYCEGAPLTAIVSPERGKFNGSFVPGPSGKIVYEPFLKGREVASKIELH